MTRTLLLVGMAALTVGCGTVKFRVPVAEVRRLAELPTAERGREVRVIPWDTPPENAPTMSGPAPAPAVIEQPVGGGGMYVDISVPIGPVGVGRPRPHAFRAARPSAAARTATVSGPGSFRGGPVARAPSSGPSPASWRGAPTGGRAPSLPHRTSFSSSGGHHHHGGGGGASGAVAGAVAVVGVIALVAALAESEQADERIDFARTFDGWVTVEREQPLHIVYQDTTEREIPLSELTPAAIVGIRYAYLTEDEGKVVPLNAPFAFSAPPLESSPPAQPPPPPRQLAPQPPPPADDAAPLDPPSSLSPPTVPPSSIEDGIVRPPLS
jgi:hypothetical protein